MSESPPQSGGKGAMEDHFRSPRNAGMLEDADISVRVENPVCGDILHLHIRKDVEGRVAACRFQVYGCPPAIAAGSLLTELIQGRTAEEMGRIGRDDISKALGGLGADRIHAAVLARDAIEAALRRWPAGAGSASGEAKKVTAKESMGKRSREGGGRKDR